MHSHVVAAVRTAGIALLLIAVAACRPAALPSSTTAIAGSTPEPASPAIGTASPPAPSSAQDPPASPGRTLEPVEEPPVATLTGRVGATATGTPGELGSFSWAGLVSDGPWIVGPAGATARTGDRLLVSFEPDPGPASAWRAHWAPVVDGVPGDPQDGGAGVGPGVAVAAPRTPGPWTLQLDAAFGAGQRATWYWRIEVSP